MRHARSHRRRIGDACKIIIVNIVNIVNIVSNVSNDTSVSRHVMAEQRPISITGNCSNRSN